MQKPEGAVAEVEEEEKPDGASNEADSENNTDESEQGEEQNSDAGGEAGKAEGSGEGDGGEAGDQEQVDGEEAQAGPDLATRIAVLEAENRILKEGKATTITEASAAAARPLTDEQKVQIADRFGVEYRTVEAFNGLVVNGLQQIWTRVEGALSEFRKDATLSRLAQDKEFADIGSYKKGMGEYLKKFAPQHHGNEEILKDAYWYAKGRGLKDVVKKALASNERNRRAGSLARPASPSGKGGGGGGSKANLKLSPTERSAYESFAKSSGMSEEDYARSLPRNRGK